jgi:hypothetical protein
MKRKIIITLFVLLALLIPFNISGNYIGAGTVNSSLNNLSIELISAPGIESKTRSASVKILTPLGGHGSGTYFIFEGYHVVLTAAHVVEYGDTYLVVNEKGGSRIGEVAHVDIYKDFAILLIPEFKEVKPIKLKLPKYDISKKIGDKVVFSGYPADQSLSTIYGDIAGFEKDIFIIHGSAWMGSSGSCVFDKSGNFLGVIVAASVAKFRGEPVILEDMVWALSSVEIDWDHAKKSLRSMN